MKKIFITVLFVLAGVINNYAWTWDTNVITEVSTTPVTGNYATIPPILELSSATKYYILDKINVAKIEGENSCILNIYDNFDVGSSTANVNLLWSVIVGSGTQNQTFEFGEGLPVYRGLAIRKTSLGGYFTNVGLRVSVFYRVK